MYNYKEELTGILSSLEVIFNIDYQPRLRPTAYALSFTFMFVYVHDVTLIIQSLMKLYGIPVA